MRQVLTKKPNSKPDDHEKFCLAVENLLLAKEKVGTGELHFCDCLRKLSKPHIYQKQPVKLEVKLPAGLRMPNYLPQYIDPNTLESRGERKGFVNAPYGTKPGMKVELTGVPLPAPNPRTMSVTVPAGWTAGMQLQVQTPDGQKIRVNVPDGTKPGMEIRASIPGPGPAPKPMVVTAPKAGSTYSFAMPTPPAPPMLITVPVGVTAGMRLQVKAPKDTRINGKTIRKIMVTVPEGTKPGMRLRVPIPTDPKQLYVSASVEEIGNNRRCSKGPFCYSNLKPEEDSVRTCPHCKKFYCRACLQQRRDREVGYH